MIMFTIYLHELIGFKNDWGRQKQDRHDRKMANHRRQYPLMITMFSVLLMVGTLLTPVTFT